MNYNKYIINVKKAYFPEWLTPVWGWLYSTNIITEFPETGHQLFYAGTSFLFYYNILCQLGVIHSHMWLSFSWSLIDIKKNKPNFCITKIVPEANNRTKNRASRNYSRPSGNRCTTMLMYKSLDKLKYAICA